VNKVVVLPTYRPRIAIPVPNSTRPDYVTRSLPQYEHAVRESGGEPVAIELKATPSEIAQAIKHCDGVLLPGSPADVDPEKYGAERHAKTAAADPFRDNTDELLLQDAYNMRKPVLGICYGLQSLNVWRTGSLDQDLPEGVNHRAGRAVAEAHRIQTDPQSKLAELLRKAGALPEAEDGTLAVNSSHHQAPDIVGDGLRLVAWCPADGVKEAVESTTDHFVLGVQWHPERDFDESVASRAIFAAFVQAAAAWHVTLSHRQSDFESMK
jgi:putative glutamine amidotransferase